MAESTSIQWTDGAVNPIMGCGGCELFPKPAEVLENIAAAMNNADSKLGMTGDKVKARFKALVDQQMRHKKSEHPAHKGSVTTTNIYHLRDRLRQEYSSEYGEAVAKAAVAAIQGSVTCYAATLHLNKGTTILDRGKDNPRKLNGGYAPTFETVTKFPDRVAKAAKWKDLLGTTSTSEPWKDGLARMIFVSDMGDAFSSDALMAFLKEDTMPAILSKDGMRHIWQWLTKRPERMAKFAQRIGGFPANVCAMTTLTGANQENLDRLAALKKVKAHMRGLSIEPLWERIPPAKLDLTGIDWVIVGGESGNGKDSRPFHIEWAEELRQHCKKKGVAFFLKQLGSNPIRHGEPVTFKDAHGGDWGEWPQELRVREFPKAFHDFRARERRASEDERPSVAGKKAKKEAAKEAVGISAENVKEFNRLNKLVSKGLAAFVDAGDALIQIKEKKLWRAGGYDSWQAYCQKVAGMTRAYAARLMEASKCFKELETSPNCHVFPKNEGQIRPLLALKDPGERQRAWLAAVESTQRRSGVPTAIEVKAVVVEMKQPQIPARKQTSRSEIRREVFGRLKSAVESRGSPAQLCALLEELAPLL